jgi:RimJ/RimL family protein N-acetyltransferase
VTSTNDISRHVIEKYGFEYVGSLHYSRRLRREAWRFDLPEEYLPED